MAISITDKAATKVQDYLKQVNDQNLALRIFVKAGGCAGYQFGLKLDKTGDSDVIEHKNGVNIVADPKSRDRDGWRLQVQLPRKLPDLRMRPQLRTQGQRTSHRCT
jgi:uncharacterized protein YneR